MDIIEEMQSRMLIQMQNKMLIEFYDFIRERKNFYRGNEKMTIRINKILITLLCDDSGLKDYMGSEMPTKEQIDEKYDEILKYEF